MGILAVLAYVVVLGLGGWAFYQMGHMAGRQAERADVERRGRQRKD